jgi:hypothetical protein
MTHIEVEVGPEGQRAGSEEFRAFLAVRNVDPAIELFTIASLAFVFGAMWTQLRFGKTLEDGTAMYDTGVAFACSPLLACDAIGEMYELLANLPPNGQFQALNIVPAEA